MDVLLFDFVLSWKPIETLQSKKRTQVVQEERKQTGLRVKDGEHVFGIAHIYASMNDTFVVSIFFPHRSGSHRVISTAFDLFLFAFFRIIALINFLDCIFFYP